MRYDNVLNEFRRDGLEGPATAFGLTKVPSGIVSPPVRSAAVATCCARTYSNWTSIPYEELP